VEATEVYGVLENDGMAEDEVDIVSGRLTEGKRSKLLRPVRAASRKLVAVVTGANPLPVNDGTEAVDVVEVVEGRERNGEMEDGG
jgi:hypothetical protein